MLGHMKERIGGKIGNQNNNAFKLRKLFAMYDTEKTGLVRGLGRSCALRTSVQLLVQARLAAHRNRVGAIISASTPSFIKKDKVLAGSPWGYAK